MIYQQKERTALHFAVEKGLLEMTAWLIDLGSDLEATEEDGEYTPLQLAARQGNIDMVQLLLDRGANIEANNIKVWRYYVIELPYDDVLLG